VGTKQVQPTVFGTGLVALDIVVSADPARKQQTWAGGTCGNILAILSYLGWSSFPVARLDTGPAAKRVCEDLTACGVSLDYAAQKPTSPAPVIIQKNRRRPDGSISHSFKFSCPKCGRWFPSYRPIGLAVAKQLEETVSRTNVFFLDRLTKANLLLAKAAATSGALVVYEPSAKSDATLFSEVGKIAHLIKYSDERLASFPAATGANSTVLLEIQTLGDQGLRYRRRKSGKFSAWRTSHAIAATRVADTCGAGDWSTAGIIHRIGALGADGLRKIGNKDLVEAIRYGQALATWACAFEGPRTGMYLTPKMAFDVQIEAILTGKTPKLAHDRVLKPTDADYCKHC